MSAFATLHWVCNIYYFKVASRLTLQKARSHWGPVRLSQVVEKADTMPSICPPPLFFICLFGFFPWTSEPRWIICHLKKKSRLPAGLTHSASVLPSIGRNYPFFFLLCRLLPADSHENSLKTCLRARVSGDQLFFFGSSSAGQAQFCKVVLSDKC